MAKIQINNPRQTINGGAKKYYFKVKGLGGPKGDKGDRGDTGSRGPQGEPGNAATVYVGSTTTLPVGQDATVENVGTQYNAVLNFGIPQGPRGPQGIQGERGEPGQTGQTGPRGPQGEKGTNATVYVGTTTTTNPGTQARVYNSGTDSNAVLNFEIPRGDVGPQPELVQTTGTSTTKAMSQNATTDALNTKQNTIDSSHKLSADLVDDTTTTHKFVTASDKTTWNAKQNALTAGNNIEITGDTISTPAIVPEVVAELPETGAESKLYLTPKNYTRSTATGNPITATVSEDAGAIESFQLDGDTFQQTYSGKNLLSIPDISNTISGVEVTVNNGVISCVGTVTTSWGFNIAGENRAVFSTALPAGDYAVSINKAVDIPIKVVFADSDSQTIGTATISAGNTSVAYTTSREAVKATVWSNAAKNTQVNISGLQVMVESGSSATSFEPFVGGQASPNPSYPQPIQTVTGLQTVEIVGKNLFDVSKADMMVARLNSSGGITLEITNRLCTRGYIEVKPSTTYTLNALPETSGKTLQAYIIGYSESGSGTAIGNYPTNAWYSFPITFTTGSNCRFIRISYRYSDDSTMATTSATNQQLELGSTASPYAPYSKQTLPINLGSIELCKLGTYQDYIWKDGDSWKVHKETGSDSASDRTWIWANVQSSGWYYTKTLYGNYETNKVNAISEKIIGVTRYDAPSISSTFITLSYDGNIGIRNKDITGSENVTQFTNWLNSLNTTWRYALATPTDTTITDQTLIAQLEAIRTASLENGANTITNSTPAPNLAGDMEIGYYEYDPTNRYDKWLWLDLNNNYEQIGS